MRCTTGLLAALALSAPLAPAFAASFDCGKAETAFERAICGDDELSRADEDLAAAYATSLDGLSPDGRETARAGQRRWLDYARSACTRDAKPARRAYDEDGIACLASIIRTRVDTLQAPRRLGDLVFVPVERFSVIPSSGESDFNPVATTEVSHPRIDGDGPEAQAFNAWAAGSVADVGPRDGSGEDDRSSDLSVVVTPVRVTAELISLTRLDSWYGHGAAHGNYGSTALHWLRAERRPLEAADVLTGEGWIQGLSRLAYEALSADLGADLSLDDPAALDEVVASPSRWQFGDGGLRLQFQPYEVAAYAVGAPEVTIAWDALAPWLAEGARDRFAR